MGLKNKITILSTFASDKIIDEQGHLSGMQEGGPGFYFKKAFVKEKINFRLLTGQKLKVEILITRKGELGKIKERPLIKKVVFKKIKTPFLLISSVLDEFNLEQLHAFKGLVFLDIQGYVRSKGSFGQKKNWRPNEMIFSNIFCLKATREELKYIPSKYIKEQKQKILLVTKGRFGCDVFYFGKKFAIKPEKIIKINNAVGAGDTFFAYFISKYIKTYNVIASVKYATARVSIFLEKNISHPSGGR